MPSIVADRFVAKGATWIDLATGDAIQLRVVTPAGRTEQLAWSSRCAVLARLRHTMLNPLVDYGALDAERLFEAYAIREPLAVTPATRQRLIADVVRFLQWHGAALMAETAPMVVRATETRPVGAVVKPVGVLLQPRAVLSALEETLDATPSVGACVIQVVGPPSSGLRTVRVLTAREARIRGYVPVAAGVLDRMPVIEELVDRHVCVLAVEGTERRDYRAVDDFLTRLGRASTRRHVVIVFRRAPHPRVSSWNVLHLDPMGVTAMAAMMFVDTRAPKTADLFDAARAAQGWPGRFLSRLGADGFEPHVSRSLVVHEATQPYDVSPPDPPVPRLPPAPSAQQSGGAVGRAADRGEALARRGRHLAAIRLLTRAAHVLERRGEPAAAARCAECLGRILLERGRPAAAIEHFERARALAAGDAVGRRATLGIALALHEDARLLEAEALLRSLLAGAVLQGEEDVAVACSLGRSVSCQGRYAEALAVVQPRIGTAASADARCHAVAAECLLAEGEVTAAVRHARSAMQGAADTRDPATLTLAHRVLALALTAAGDAPAAEEHVREALRHAARARLAIEVLRARSAHVAVLAAAGADRARVAALTTRLAVAARRETLPKLVRGELLRTLEGLTGNRGSGRMAAVTDLESLMEMCHASADDRDALNRLCAAVSDRVRAASTAIVCAQSRRMVAHNGRPWNGESAVLARVLTSAASVPPSPGAAIEAAEPVKFAGEVIGAVVCRWLPGTEVLIERACPVVKAAALAAAAPLRAMLDRSVEASSAPGWHDMIGESAAATALRASAARAARSPFPVLIEGESGSGKELVARAIHRLSARRDRRFCAVNCAALTDDLLETELFGHVRGAFTGAVGERVGLFEEADGGTLFLDEIGELSPRGQAKLLRVIQEGEIRRVGESFARRVDVRVVAATNRHLEDEAAAGRFRQDLRFRLDVVRIVVPPLRDRPGDIPLLAVHCWNEAARRVGSRATLAPDALAALARYAWPGNVRELQNAIAWLAVHAPQRGRVGAAALPASIATTAPADGLTFEAAREEFERRFLVSALARANGHRTTAAAAMGLTRQGLAKMIRRLNVDERPLEW